jgi:putative membrane protein
LHSILKGIILGFVIVLPGMSGGTAFIILGLYEKIINDLSRFNLKPYLPLVCGTIGGIFVGGFFFSMLFASYRDITSAFLMGLLLASIKTVFNSRPHPSAGRILILAAGFLLAFLLANEPLGIVAESSEINWAVLVLGGAFSSATMLIPGIPGSSVLILLGIYDDVLFYIKEFALINLFIFGAGCLLGIFFLAKVLDKLYSRYQAPTAYFFAGLIAGSARVLLPAFFNIPVFLAFIAGFILVWRWGGGK